MRTRPATWAGLRVGHGPVICLCIAAVAFLVIVTRSATFFHDEWLYIDGRSLADPASWFRPHNEHLVALHVVIYMTLQAMFGLSTYTPYLLVLFAAHVAFAGGIYALVDRHSGRVPALIAAAAVLFLGPGYLNLFWAFQMGFVGSAAFGLWAVVFARDRPGVSAALLGTGILLTSTALFLVPAVAVYGRSRRALAAALVPVLIYGAWYVLIGHAMSVRGQPPTLIGGAAFFVDGVASSASALTLMPGGLALTLAAAAVLLARNTLALLGLTALATEFGVLAISRQGFGAPGESHYVYLGAAFLVLVFAAVKVPRVAQPAVALLVIATIVVNALSLVAWGVEWPAYMAAH